MDASGQTKYAGVQHRYWYRFVSNKTRTWLYMFNGRHYNPTMSVGSQQRATNIQSGRCAE